jgi:hypothetical protein
MSKLLIAWILRAWPVLATAAFGAIHASLLAALPTLAVLVNKLTGTSLQVVGGLIVLRAVNQNLGLFRSQSFTSVVVDWFREFPLIRRATSVTLAGSGSISITGSASLTGKRAANTLEERLAEAERQIEEVRTLVTTKTTELNSRIDSVKSELSSSIDSHGKTVRALTEKIERAAVGGFKEQAFGVMLAIYGAVVSVFA